MSSGVRSSKEDYDVNHSEVLTYGGTIVMGQTKNVTALDKHVNCYGKIPASNAFQLLIAAP
jgi:hypothetical protein